MAVGEKALLQGIGKRLPMSGGQMTGPLILAADPALALEAATKQYVDAADTSILSGLAAYLLKAGGTMTGALILAADPAVALGAATKQYVDAAVATAGGIGDWARRGRRTVAIQAPDLASQVGNHIGATWLESGTAGAVTVAGGRFIARSCNASNGASAYYATVTSLAWWDHRPLAHIKARMPATISNMTTWFSFNSPISATATPPADSAGFRYASGTDTNWTAFSTNGAAAATLVDTGVAVATATNYEFEIDATDWPNSIKYKINGTQVANITTNLPSASASLVPWARVYTTEAVLKTILISYFRVDTD